MCSAQVQMEDIYDDMDKLVHETELLWDSLQCYSILMHSILPAHVVARLHTRLLLVRLRSLNSPRQSQ